MNWKRFGKGLVGAVGVVLSSLAVTHGDQPWVAVLIAVATFLGVYETPYHPA